MSGLHPVDIAVLLIYLVGITLIGVWSAKRIKTMQEYFMPRHFGKAMMITNAFGTGTASDQAVVVAAATFRSGVSGIWLQWIWLPVTPFYWLLAPIMRRLRAITTADVYKLRYDGSVASLFAVVGIVGLSVKIGLILKGAGELIESATGGGLQAEVAIPLVTVLFVLYGMAGGLSAAIITDFFQGILTVLFSFALLPFVLKDVGGMEGIRETINDPKLLELVNSEGIGLFFVIMFSLQALAGIVGQPFIMGVCSAGRTEMDGRVGIVVGNIIKRFCTMAWCITSLAAIAWYLNRGVDLATVKPDHVYGDVAREFLPRVMHGLLGIFLASLLASVMSSCDAFMVSSSALFTQNIYKPLAPGKPDSHYLRVGRVASLAVVVGGLAFAYWVPNVEVALKTWFRIAPMVGIAFWIGLFWRRATPAGAWATAIAGFGTWWLLSQPVAIGWIQSLPFAEELGMIAQRTGKAAAIAEPWTILSYTLAAGIACVVGSLLTNPVDPQRLDDFYDLTRTPIQPGEVIAEPCTLPAGVEPAERAMLLTAGGLEIPKPSTTAIAGFLAAWVAVAGLVVIFLWMIY